MNPIFLQTQLQLPYRRKTWQTLLPQIIPGVELFTQAVEMPLTTEAQRALATGLRQIGRAVLRDEIGNERIVAIFEADVVPGVDVVRNRVALRQLVSRCIDEVSAHAVLAYFVQPGASAYRLTYAAKESIHREDLSVETTETATKRYTYVLGPGEARRTAAQRLAGLAANRDTKKWKDVADAFSVEKLNDEFFKTYKEHYQAFCKHLLNSTATAVVFDLKLRGLKDKELDKALKPVRDFVKKLLGRLVFLHFIQKKQWLGCPADRTDWTQGDPTFIQTWFARTTGRDRFYRDFLVPLFYDALNNNGRDRSLFAPTGTRVPYLNGGLFERELVPGSGHKPLEVEKLDLPDVLFAGLLEFLSQYNFTIDENDPDDHEIGIDPEMLGHIFENLLEDNKDKGAYYTPKAIVQYMCQQSLIHYLQGHFRPDGGTTSVSSVDATERVPPTEAEAAIERLIRLKEPIDPRDARSWLTIHAHRLEELLDDVKICDPAIGSGAFPIGLLQEIYWTRLTLHPGLERAKAKRDIIQKSIHGVDLDAGAVEIARLRCWLALIVEEDQPRPLPNLDFKIMQGDSLLESFEGIPLDQLMPSVRPLYERAVQQKELDLGPVVREKLQLELSEEDRLRFAKLLGDYFPCEDPAEKSRLHIEIDTFVLKHIDYNVDQFLRREEAELAQLQHGIDEKRKTAKKYELSPREKRRIKALEADIRANRARKAKLHGLADIPERPYFLWHLFFQDVFVRGGFDIVIANPPFVLLQEGRVTEEESVRFRSLYRVAAFKLDLYHLFIERGTTLAAANGVICYITPANFLTNNYAMRLRRFLAEVTAIQEVIVYDDDVFAASVNNVTFLLNRGITSSPLIRFRRGRLKNGDLRLAEAGSFPQKDVVSPHYLLTPPALGSSRDLASKIADSADELGGMARVCFGMQLRDRSKHTRDVLEAVAQPERLSADYRQCISGRDIGRYCLKYVPRYCYFNRIAKRGGCWDEALHLAKNKIVLRQIGLYPEGALDTKGIPVLNTAFMVVPNEPSLAFPIMAILNSKVIRYFWQTRFRDDRKTFPKIKGEYLKELPIPIACPEVQTQLAALVAQACATAGLELAEIEEKINQIVYRLFKLEPDEIALIEGATASTKPALDNKSALFTRILPELSAAAPYFSHNAITKRLADLTIEMADHSLRVYLSEAMEKGIVHDAGRGWYSRLADRCVLDPKPVAKLIHQLEKKFPLLDFTCWSTQQVNPWMHHILSKFLTFVNVDPDGLLAVAEFLRAEGYEVNANPKGNRTAEVRANGKTVIIRPLNTHAPKEGHFAPPEAVLVDLFKENLALTIMDAADFKGMAQQLAATNRLLWAALSHYADKRGIAIGELFAQVNVLTAKL